MSAARRADLVYAAAIVTALALLFVSGATGHRDDTIRHSDFSYLWAGPRTILDGGDPYDASSWSASVATLGTEPFDDPHVYSYPPYVALALLPLAALPLPLAAGLWTWGSMAAAAIALRRLVHAVAPGAPLLHGIAAATLFLSQPAVVSFYSGQSSFVLVAAISLAIATKRGWARSAALTVLIGKPQIGVTIIAGFASRAVRRHEVASAVATIVPSLLIVGASALIATRASASWLTDVPRERIAEPQIATLAAAFGPVAAIVVIMLALGIAVAADPRPIESAALWITVSLVVAPYARSYDHLLLLAPLVLLAPAHPRLAVAALVSLLVAPWLLFLVVAPAFGSESILVVVPVAVFALVAFASRLPPAVRDG